MNRRFFLQLLGVGAGAAVLDGGSDLEVISTLPEHLLGVPHLVVGRANYTGRLFDGNCWVSGRNVSVVPIPTTGFGHTRFPMDPVSDGQAQTMLEQDQEIGLSIPDNSYSETFEEALLAFRQKAVQDLAVVGSRGVPVEPDSDNPSTLVTFCSAPLKVCQTDAGWHIPYVTYDYLPSLNHDLDTYPVVRHYVVRGTVRPVLQWSDSGEIPFETDFEGDQERFQFLQNQTRALIREVKGYEVDWSGRRVPFV